MREIKSFKSNVVDTIILLLEEQLIRENKHLMKTDTILRMCRNHINLSDSAVEREELLEIGMRQVIQSRLYAHGYFSVRIGYFVNVEKCDNCWYLKQIIDGKDGVIVGKTEARNRLAKLMSEAGQSRYIQGENNELILIEGKTAEEIEADLEADAV